MPLSFSNYLQLLGSGIYRQRAKIQLLHYQNLLPYREIQGDIVDGSGSLNIQRVNGVRRTCNFQLINSTISQVGKYIPSPKDQYLSPRQPIRLWLGLADENDQEYLFSSGIYFLSDPSLTSEISRSVVELSMSDPFALFDDSLGGTLLNTYIVSNGSNIYDVINSILQTENSYPLPCILDSVYASETTPYTITKETGSNFGEILTDLSYLVSGNLFFNENGQLCLRQDTNDITKGSIFDFSTNTAQYLGASSKFNYPDFYNSILTIGSNSNSGSVYKYEAVNTNLLSPFSVNNIGFKRTKIIEDPNLDSDLKCQWRSEFELKRCLAVQNEVSISCVPIHFLDVDRVCTLTDSNFGFNNERFLINSIDLPFGVGQQMTVNCVKAIDLDFNDA